MRLAIMIVGTGLALAACDVTSPQSHVFGGLRVYSRQLFATPEECAAAQANGTTYCTQEATFCPDFRASLRITDKDLAADYRIRRDTLTLGFAVNQGTPPEMHFTVASDESSITAVATGEVWSRDLARELALADICK